jgi:hypothetical protein
MTSSSEIFRTTAPAANLEVLDCHGWAQLHHSLINADFVGLNVVFIGTPFRSPLPSRAHAENFSGARLPAPPYDSMFINACKAERMSYEWLSSAQPL